MQDKTVNMFSSISTEVLQKELERRKAADVKPTMLMERDFLPLAKLCQQYIDDLAADNTNEDTGHYIFEAAMETFFGKDVWEWINKRLA